MIYELRRRKVFRGAAIYLFAAWAVLQVVDVVGDAAGLPTWTMRVLLYLAAIGFPLAVFLGWRYEFGADGLVKTAATSAKDSERSSLSAKDYLAIFTLVLISGAAAWQIVPTLIEQQRELELAGPAIAAIPNSIAVVPFEEISADASGGFLADGMSDTITHVLGQVEGLVVTARTSALAFKGSSKQVFEIARELRVAYILEGSVQRSGSNMRIRATLVDPRNQVELWSRQFDRPIDDIFAVQDEIAKEVVVALGKNIDLGTEAVGERYRPSLESYREYTLGLKAQETRSVAGVAEAEANFRRAIELDPNFSLAYVALANNLSMREGVGLDDSVIEMRPLVEKALELNPLSGDALTTLASVLWVEGDRDLVEPTLLKAIELSPNLVAARTAFASWLMAGSRHDESLAQARIAFEIDPKNIETMLLLSQSLWNVARAEESIAMAREMLRNFPDDPSGYQRLSRTLLQMGRAGESMLYSQALVALDPDSRRKMRNLCSGWMQLWDDDATQNCYREYLARWPDDLEVQKQLALSLGDYDNAIRLAAEQAAAEPWRDYRTMQHAFFLEVAGHYEEVRQVLSARYPAMLGEEPPVNDFLTWPALMLAHALLRTGDTEAGLRLLAAVEQQVSRMRLLQSGGLVAGYEESQIYALRGDIDLALDSLERIVNSGWLFFSSAVLVDSKLDVLRGTERYAGLEQKLRERAAEEREWYQEHKDDPLY